MGQMECTRFAMTAETPTEKDISKKNSIIELIRFLAACEIVSYHVDAPWSRYVSVLPIFLVFSIVFAVSSKLAAKAQWKKAFARIIQPWLFWSAAYGLARIVRIIIFHNPTGSEFHWWMLASGTTIHLWFLPFAFLSNMAVLHFFKQLQLKLTPRNSHIIATLGGLLLLISTMILPKVEDILVLKEWIFLAPVILVGLLFSSFYYSYSRLMFAHGLWIVVLFCIGIMALNRRIGLAYLSPVIICSFVFSYKPSGSSNFFNYLGKLSYGIYLIHMLVWYPWTHLVIEQGSMELLLLTLFPLIVVTALLHKTIFRKFM